MTIWVRNVQQVLDRYELTEELLAKADITPVEFHDWIEGIEAQSTEDTIGKAYKFMGLTYNAETDDVYESFVHDFACRLKGELTDSEWVEFEREVDDVYKCIVESLSGVHSDTDVSIVMHALFKHAAELAIIAKDKFSKKKFLALADASYDDAEEELKTDTSSH